MGDVLDMRRHLPHAPDGEHAVHQLAVATMIRRIGALQGGNMRPALALHIGAQLFGILRSLQRSAVHLVGKRHRIGQHGPQIGIARDDVEPRLRHPINPGRVLHRLVHRKRIALRHRIKQAESLKPLRRAKIGHQNLSSHGFSNVGSYDLKNKGLKIEERFRALSGQR
ncbi:hypothetical protein ACFSLT_21915 [Novosphingobium resinovorum]